MNTPSDQNAGLTKAVYLLDPHRPFKGKDGNLYTTREEIAECLEKNFEHYKNDLLNPNAPFYLFFEARGYKKEADKFRSLFKTLQKEAALNTIILFLQGDVLIIGDYKISKIEELLQLDKATNKKVINDLENANSKVSLWFNRDASFNERVLEIISKDFDKIIPLFSFALYNYHDKKLNIYQTIEKALPIIKSKTDKDEKLLDIVEYILDIVEYITISIELYFIYQIISGIAPTVFLKKFMEFVEKNKGTFPEFFKELTSLLDEDFFGPIKNDINQDEGDDKVLKDFIDTYNDTISTLIKINPQMPYGERYKKEKALIDSQTKLIEERIETEKREKVEIVEKEYANLLTRKKLVYRKGTAKDKYNRKIIYSFVF
jgi:hypothetical protein